MSRYLKDKKPSNRLLLIKQVLVLVMKIAFILFIIAGLITFTVSKLSPETLNPKAVGVYDDVSPVSNFFKSVSRYFMTIVTEVDHVVNANLYAERLRLVQDSEAQAKLKLYLLKEENKNLKKLLNYRPKQYNSFITARITSRNPGPFVQKAFIQADDLSNIEKYDIVINEDGLVGQIDEVSDDSAIVILISDKQSNIPVKSKNSGKRAILVGSGSNSAELDFILSTKNLVVGEEIFTSGDGGIFPPDIPVGYIDKIENERVFIETYADWSSLDYVFIIK